jgi:hypothetical protein
MWRLVKVLKTKDLQKFWGLGLELIRVCAPLGGAQARLNGRVGPGILGLAEEAAYGDFYRCEWARGQ